MMPIRTLECSENARLIAESTDDLATQRDKRLVVSEKDILTANSLSRTRNVKTTR